jgi:hypothetical protein
MKSRRLMAAAFETNDRSSYRQEPVLWKATNVRFWSKADIGNAIDHVRFTPKADICSAVRFGSKADILCPIDTLPLAVRFSGKVLPMEAQMVSVDVIRTCLV